MDISGIDTIGSDYYYTPGTVLRNCEENREGYEQDIEAVRQEDFVSPEEKYQELLVNRQQKMQRLGLEYVDAFNCTWEEFQGLCSRVLESTEYDACPLEEVGITVADETVKMDCLGYLRAWSEQESARGNMVGYHMGTRLSGALANYFADVQGESREMVVNGEIVKWRYVEEGMWTTKFSPDLGFTMIFGGGYFEMIFQYADDSTAENPIVKVQVSSGEGNEPVIREYRIVLSEVDPRNATQMEMFALLAHRDKQGNGMNNAYGDSSYMMGHNLGIFENTVTLDEFVNGKKDWVKAYDDKIEEIKILVENAAFADAKKEYMIGKFQMTRDEWKELLEILDFTFFGKRY